MHAILEEITSSIGNQLDGVRDARACRFHNYLKMRLLDGVVHFGLQQESVELGERVPAIGDLGERSLSHDSGQHHGAADSVFVDICSCWAMGSRPEDGWIGRVHVHSGDVLERREPSVGCSLEGFNGQDHRDGRSEVIPHQDDMVVVEGRVGSQGGRVLGHGVSHMDVVFITANDEGNEDG